MRWVTIPVLTVLVVALIPIPAQADHDDRGRVEVRGVVVAIDRFGGTFQVQGRSRFGDGHLWLIVVDRRTDFELRRRDRYDNRDRHDNDDRARDLGHRDRWLRLLEIGDGVEVTGRFIGRRTILAREVEVFARHRPIEGPPVVIVPTPVIIFPRPGIIIVGREFLLTGRASPRTQIIIVVTTTLGAAVLWKHDLWAFADDDGQFNVWIRPGAVHRGAQHQIAVRSRHPGGESPPSVVVVQQH